MAAIHFFHARNTSGHLGCFGVMLWGDALGGALKSKAAMDDALGGALKMNVALGYAPPVKRLERNLALPVK